jgi:hypothetical protein
MQLRKLSGYNYVNFVSGRWESDPLPSPWEGDILPVNYARNQPHHSKKFILRRAFLKFNTPHWNLELYWVIISAMVEIDSVASATSDVV